MTPVHVLRQQPVLLLELRPKPLQQRTLLTVVHRECEQAPERAGQRHHPRLVRHAPLLVERHDPQLVSSGHQGHHHARMAVRQIEHPVKGISIPLGVVVIVEGSRVPTREQALDRGERVEREPVTRDVGSHQRSCGHTNPQLVAVEFHDGRQVEWNDLPQGREGIREQPVDGGNRGAEPCGGAQVAGEIDGSGYHDISSQ